MNLSSYYPYENFQSELFCKKLWNVMFWNIDFRPQTWSLHNLKISKNFRKWPNASLLENQDPLWKTASNSALFPLNFTIRQKP